MSEVGYISLNKYMLSHPRLSKLAVFSCHAITALVYLTYPVFLLAVYGWTDAFPIKIVLVPLISLIIVSIIRRLLNVPRIYETYDITPLYNKKTKGQSFPSRHTFAIFIISFTIYLVYKEIGIALFILGVVLAMLRVIIGVHYVRDVLSGLLCAIISALIGYIII